MEIWDIPCLQEQSAWTCKGDSDVCGNERSKEKGRRQQQEGHPHR